MKVSLQIMIIFTIIHWFSRSRFAIWARFGQWILCSNSCLPLPFQFQPNGSLMLQDDELLVTHSANGLNGLQNGLQSTKSVFLKISFRFLVNCYLGEAFMINNFETQNEHLIIVLSKFDRYVVMNLKVNLWFFLVCIPLGFWCGNYSPWVFRAWK